MSLQQYQDVNSLPTLHMEPAEPCSHPITAHYSFDMAQQFTIPVIPSNQDQAISWLPENVDFLAFAMKHYPAKWIFLLKSHVTQEREQITSSASSTTSLKTMGWGRWMRTSMQTIAQGQIKIMPWYIIWLGESCLACTRTSLCHSWLSGTLSSHLIGVLVSWNNATGRQRWGHLQTLHK